MANETLSSSKVFHNDDRPHTIKVEMFTKCFYVLGFDLTLDRDEEHIILPLQGNVLI